MTTSKDQIKYPSHLISQHTLLDGTRPTAPDEAKINKEFGSNLCEFDMIVTDGWQNLGIGTILTNALIKAQKIMELNQ